MTLGYLFYGNGFMSNALPVPVRVIDKPPCASVADLVRIVTEIHQASGSKLLWYRGQEDSTWKLLPGIFRDGLKSQEKNAFLEFRDKSPLRHPNVPAQNDFSSWLALAQHYRLPTRLLDWSSSPLIAAYFSIANTCKCDSAIWVLEPIALNQKNDPNSGVYCLDHTIVDRHVRAILGAGSEQPQGISSIGSNQFDSRMLVQQGSFTIHSDETPLEQYATEFIWKIIIHSQHRIQIKNELRMLGFSQSRVFLDLENLALDIKSQMVAGERQNRAQA